MKGFQSQLGTSLQFFWWYVKIECTSTLCFQTYCPDIIPKSYSIKNKVIHSLYSCNYSFKSFKFCLLSFLRTYHGPLDSNKLPINIMKLKSYLSSDICFIGNLPRGKINLFLFTGPGRSTVSSPKSPL